MKVIENAKELESLLKQDNAILLDFYADTCPPCRALMPLVEKLAGKYEGKIEFQKVDVHKFPELRTQYKIGSIPTLLFVKKSEIVEKTVGVIAESELTEKLNNLIEV